MIVDFLRYVTFSKAETNLSNVLSGRDWNMKFVINVFFRKVDSSYVLLNVGGMKPNVFPGGGG